MELLSNNPGLADAVRKMLDEELAKPPKTQSIVPALSAVPSGVISARAARDLCDALEMAVMWANRRRTSPFWLDAARDAVAKARGEALRETGR